MAGAWRIMGLEQRKRRMLRLSGSVVGGVAVAFSAVLLVAARGRGDEAGLILFALVPALAGAAVVTLLVHQMKRVRLVLSDEGVEYHAFGSSIRAGWDAIVGLGPVTHGLFTGDGLHLRGSVDRRAPLLLRLSGLATPDLGIPLAPFVAQLRGSWLEFELRRRAPALHGPST